MTKVGAFDVLNRVNFSKMSVFKSDLPVAFTKFILKLE